MIHGTHAFPSQYSSVAQSEEEEEPQILLLQFPLQQGLSVEQLSPLDPQPESEEETHTLLLQFPLQQSESEEQVPPLAIQGPQLLLIQVPVQHCDPVEQEPSVATQGSETHEPLIQLCLQQSESVLQGLPFVPQFPFPPPPPPFPPPLLEEELLFST